MAWGRRRVGLRSARRGRHHGHDHDHAVEAAPAGVFTDLETDGAFVRDSRTGAMFHRGQSSFREASRRDSLHISVGDDGRVSAHVDRFSPLAARRRARGTRYSVVGVVVHNAGVLADYARLLVSGRFGEHRCVLDCEKVEIVDPDGENPEPHPQP